VRAFLRSALLCFGLTLVVMAAPRIASAEAGGVGILVLKEHGIGSAAQAQPYVDKFVALAAKHNGWASSKAQFQTTRAAADTFVQAEKPHYGILSLAAFLALKGKYTLDVIGQVAVARAGGQQYSLISKSAADLAGCKGKRLATDHADDAKFVEQVVFGGKLKLADFTLVATTRPLQGIKKVASGEAECALIDDAQLAELSHLEGAEGIRSVWSSDKLPPMAVVAFPSAPAAERKAFQASFGKLCDGDGKTACAEVGLQSFKVAADGDYAAVIAAYK
jgi:hypothetical protein